MKLKLLLTVGLAIGLTGCISVKSYPDQKYSDLSFTNVTIPANTSFNVTTEFQMNGKSKSAGKKQLDKVVEKVFAKAGIANVPEGAQLSILCNNIGDVGDAVAKGFGTGLTLGLAGSTVSDGYEFTFAMTDASGTQTKAYNHVIHSTVGNAKAPIENVEGVTPLAAFEAIFEDVLLQYLKEMNASGDIALNSTTTFLAP